MNYENEKNNHNEIEEDEVIDDSKRKYLLRTIALCTAVIFGLMVLSPLLENLNLPSLKFLNESFELTQRSEVKKYQKAVATITVGAKKGTGFNVEKEGLIVTNAHVVENKNNVTVSFYKGKKFKGEVWKVYKDIDIALIRIDGKNLPKLELEQSFETNGKDEVLIIGNPLDYEGVANKGIVQGMAKVNGIDEPVLLVEAPINKGHSGSPIINKDGKVIGIVFATITDVNYDDRVLGVAIPIEYYKRK